MRAGDRARRLATWLLLGASLAGALLYVGMRVVVPSDGGRIAFYGDAWSAAGIAIAPIDPPQPELEDGDRVESIAGRSMDAWAGLVLDSGVARPTGDPVPYTVERDGTQASIGVAWAPPPIAATLAAGWSVILFSVAIAGVAALVFVRRPDVPAATALVIVASGAAGSSVPWYLGATTSDVALGGPFLLQALLTAGLYMVMWPAAVHLGLVFPSPAAVVSRRPRLIPAIYAVTLGAYAALLAGSRVASPSVLDWVGGWPRVQLAVVVPCLLVWLVLAARAYLRPPDPVARSRSRWAALGALTSVVLGLVLFQVPELVVGGSLVPASWIGLIALPLPIGLAIGILRDRLFDIEVVLNRTLVYGSLTLVVIGVYVVTTIGLGMAIGPGHGYVVELVAIGLAALVALPLRDGLQRSVNRMMYGQRDEPLRAMRRLGARLEVAADPDRAFPAVAETVADALRLPWVVVEVTDELGTSRIVAERGAPVATFETIDLVHGATPVGRLVLGVRSGDRRFRADELALLHDLARQAGAAIHAQQLRDALARSREQLVVAREEERRRLRRDLHDGLGPALAAIGMRAEASAAVLDDDPETARRQLDALSTEVREALADVRRLVDGLRPPALDELGLAGAIGHQAARLDRGSATETGPRGDTGTAAIHVECEPAPLPELPAAVEVAAYRIAVEAMTNVVRHAGASACLVRLQAGSQLTVEVTDDGRGLPDVPRSGTGLESMRERAAEVGGEVEVERRPEGGTRVFARLPIGRATA
jgi:signal transduction histidine kinase